MLRIPALAIASLIALSLPTGSASAESLAGTWSGTGYAAPASGQREKVACRITYSPQGSKVFAVVATCASPSTKVVQTGQLTMVDRNRYIGEVYNAEYNISGRVRVVISGSRQTVTFTSSQGSGQATLTKR
ncbi:MAG: hypothetical protein AB1749_11510 [Pseudomonadota bacterium]